MGWFVAEISLIGRRELLSALGGLLLLLILLEDRRRPLLADREGAVLSELGDLIIGVFALVLVEEGVALALLLPLVVDAKRLEDGDRDDELLAAMEELGLFLCKGIKLDGGDADAFDDATFCILSANDCSWFFLADAGLAALVVIVPAEENLAGAELVDTAGIGTVGGGKSIDVGGRRPIRLLRPSNHPLPAVIVTPSVSRLSADSSRGEADFGFAGSAVFIVGVAAVF